MAIKTSELFGRLIADPKFSAAIKKDIDVVTVSLDLTDTQAALLKKIVEKPTMSVAELAAEVAASGHGIFAGG